MIEKTILAAASASSNNPAAQTALALILLALAEPINSRSQNEVYDLIEKWARTLQGLDPVRLDDLTAKMKATQASTVARASPLKHAS